MNVTFYAKILSKREKSVNESRFIKTNVFFRVNEFEVGVNNSIFSGNEQ